MDLRNEESPIEIITFDPTLDDPELSQPQWRNPQLTERINSRSYNVRVFYMHPSRTNYPKE